MKKQYIIFALLPLFIWSACKDKELSPVFQAGTAPSITSPAAGADFTFTEANAADLFGAVTWTASDFGFDAGVEYTLELDLAGNDFAEPVNLGTVNATTIDDLINGKLNGVLISKGLSGNTTSAVELRVVASVSSEVASVISAPISINVTPFEAAIDYPKLQVPGSYQNWNPEDETTVIHSLASDKTYEGYIYFPDDNALYKYTDGTSWDVNWGDTGADGTLDADGDNMELPTAGLYRLNVDINALTHRSVKTDWGLIGSSTPDEWNSDQDMTFDVDKGTYSITIDLIAGEIKFRANDAWDIDFGDDDANGSLEYGGANIPVAEAGNYTIDLILNVAAYTYTITKN